MSDPSMPPPLSTSPYHWSNYDASPAPAWEPPRPRHKRRRWPWIVAVVVVLVVLGGVRGYVAYKADITNAKDNTLSDKESRAIDKGVAEVPPEDRAGMCRAIAESGDDEIRRQWIVKYSTYLAESSTAATTPTWAAWPGTDCGPRCPADGGEPVGQADYARPLR